MLLRRVPAITNPLKARANLPLISNYFNVRCYQSDQGQNNGGYNQRSTNYQPETQQYTQQSENKDGQEQQTSLFNFELGDDVVVSVEPFRGIPIIHVRKHYYDKKSKLRRPGKNGVTLLARNLDKFIMYLDDIDADVQRLNGEQGNIDAKYSFELDNPPRSKIVQVVVQNSVPLIFFQQVQNEITKYISITVEQYELLKSILANLKTVVSAATPQTPSETLFELPLSNWTIARVIKYGNKSYVDLRKLLNTNASEPNPSPAAGGYNFSKVGITLNNFEWQNLMDNLEPLYNAIRAGDTAYFLDVGRNRRVNLSLYNQVWYISIREFYHVTATDQFLPSKKGVNMRMEEWNLFVEQFPAISQALQAASTEKQ